MNTLPAPDREVAKVVGEMLERAGISRKRASEITGIPRATLLRRLNGASFQLLELRAIAEMLGVTVSDIVTQAEQDAA